MLNKLLPLLLCTVVLCSCSLSLNAEELLSPPRLTTQQAQIYDALETAIGTTEFKLKYPKRGEYLSACILRDIDHDGEEEAIAFYELTVAGVTSTWMSLLEFENGAWRSIKEIPGSGKEIDLVSFANVTGNQTDNIIVGWTTSGQESNSCDIYSYSENQLVKAHETEFLYNDMLIYNVDDNDLSEVILCTKSSTRIGTMRLIKYRAGKVVTTSEIRMPSGTIGYQQLTYGKLTENLNAIFADIILNDGRMTTKIAFVEGSIIEDITEEDIGIYESFDRPASSIVCKDQNNDGYIDIPVNYPLPGYEEVAVQDKIERTEYKSLIAGEMIAVGNVIINSAKGYSLSIPDSWVDRVTVNVQPDTGEWRFSIYIGDVSNATAELLRIKVVSPSDYQDKLEMAEYQTIATRGINEYKVHIPKEIYPGFSITYEELHNLFSLI